jgi:hypothetical protein
MKSLSFAVISILVWVCNIQKTNAQWVLNFGTASTVAPKDFAFISGTGGQFTFIKNPSSTNFTPFLAHAGIRYGLTNNFDIGYRLCTVALPYSSVGPTLGSAVDVKLRLTNQSSDWQFCVVGGGGFAYVSILDAHKAAWSPGGLLSLSKKLKNKSVLTWNARILKTVIPSAPDGSSGDYVNIIGGSMNYLSNLNKVIAIIPEIGLFDLKGKINNVQADGLGMQIGVVLKVDWKEANSKR